MSSLRYYDYPFVEEYFRNLVRRGMPPDKAARHIGRMIRAFRLMTDPRLAGVWCGYSADKNGAMVIVNRETGERLNPSKIQTRPRTMFDPGAMSLRALAALDSMSGPDREKAALAAAVMTPRNAKIEELTARLKANPNDGTTQKDYEDELRTCGFSRDDSRDMVRQARKMAGLAPVKRGAKPQAKK